MTVCWDNVHNWYDCILSCIMRCCAHTRRSDYLARLTRHCCPQFNLTMMEHETTSMSQNHCIARQCGHALFTLISSSYQAQSMLLHVIAWWSAFLVSIMHYMHFKVTKYSYNEASGDYHNKQKIIRIHTRFPFPSNAKLECIWLRSEHLQLKSEAMSSIMISMQEFSLLLYNSISIARTSYGHHMTVVYVK